MQTSHRKFATHLNLVAATVLDVRRELTARFKREEYEQALELAHQWWARCERGHEARRGLAPMLRHAMAAAEAALQERPWSFED